MNPQIKKFFPFTYQKSETCLLLNGFLSYVLDKYGLHQVSSDGGTWYPPQACIFLKLNHHLHSPFKKSIIERTIQYIKDRTDNLTITFLAKRTSVN